MEWNPCKTCFLKKINSEVKLESLHVNSLKNVEARYEALENLNVMENFTKAEEKCNMKDYSLALTLDGKKCL